MIKKTFTSLAVAAALVSTGSFAEDKKEAKGLSVATIEQINLVHKLVDLGDAKKDPILLLAAAKLQKGLTVDAVAQSAESRDFTAVLERAKKFAAGNDDVVALIEDAEAAKTKGYHPHGYSFGSTCIGYC